GSLDARVRQWVKLESLRTGKVSPSARARAVQRANGQSDPASPDNDIEQLVFHAWQSVLGIDEIGVEETFFDLGGHSLLAMQVVAKLRAAYRVDISLRDFFEAPTIAQLSSVIRDKIVQDIENMSDDEVRELISN